MAAEAKSDAVTVADPAKQRSPGMLMVLQTIAGAASGAITKTATAPLERLKIIFQVQVSCRGASRCELDLCLLEAAHLCTG